MDAGALSLPPPIVPADGAGIAQRPRSMREAAEDFEAVFLSQMLAPVFEQLGEDPLIGGGYAGKVYQSLLVDELGRSMAKAGGVGLADAVYRELVKAQAATQAEPGTTGPASPVGGIGKQREAASRSAALIQTVEGDR